ncbi:hypothetical protein ASPCAL12076 [Aspergillus calidoustus]|uniref:Uncharacterized protein n=1 Tax=Aspergillus calidoustus TaxID=454130 RepID=A0A0U5GBG8_ASPCI|nr:hypothetical protein ASPCAL12076 [Aspergillus calidoustus]
MASGVAYRCPDLRGYALTIRRFYAREPTPTASLYKAPPSKRSRGRPKPIGLLKRLPLELIHAVLLNLNYTSHKQTPPRQQNRPPHRRVPPRLLPPPDPHPRYAPGNGCVQMTCPGREFAPLLYLPTMTRSCFKCNRVRGEYQPRLVTDIYSTYALSWRDMNNKVHPLPVIRTIPIHPPWAPRRIADIGQALELAITIHGSLAAVEHAAREREERNRTAYQAALKEWVIWNGDGEEEDNTKWRRTRKGKKTRSPSPTPIPRRPRVPHKRFKSLLTGQGADNWRFRATVAFPYFDRKMQTVETGVYCRACTYHWDKGYADDWRPAATSFHPHSPNREARFRAFLEKDIPAHFAVCKNMNRGYDFAESRLHPLERQADGEDFFVFPEDWE